MCLLARSPAQFLSVRILLIQVTESNKRFCSLATPDGRGLVAIGCAEGVWIGLRHDPKCTHTFALLRQTTQLFLVIAMRRVLHLKMVTQCAMLEDFGIFLVLADKASREVGGFFKYLTPL